MQDHFQRLLKAVLRETLVQAGHDPRKYKMSAAGAAMIQLAAEEVCCENLRNLAVLAAHRNWSTIQRQDVLALQHLVDGLSLSTLGTLKADMRACIHRQEADYAVLCRHKATKRRQLLKQYLGKGLRLVKARVSYRANIGFVAVRPSYQQLFEAKKTCSQAHPPHSLRSKHVLHPYAFLHLQADKEWFDKQTKRSAAEAVLEGPADLVRASLKLV